VSRKITILLSMFTFSRFVKFDDYTLLLNWRRVVFYTDMLSFLNDSLTHALNMNVTFNWPQRVAEILMAFDDGVHTGKNISIMPLIGSNFS
jgi:hypothetical protein